jgi:hypothetical protein
MNSETVTISESHVRLDCNFILLILQVRAIEKNPQTPLKVIKIIRLLWRLHLGFANSCSLQFTRNGKK